MGHPDRLAEIKEVWAKATPGMWVMCPPQTMRNAEVDLMQRIGAGGISVFCYVARAGRDDAAALVAAPEHIEWCLKTIGVLRKRLRDAGLADGV